jgi:hypothetical protein
MSRAGFRLSTCVVWSMKDATAPCCPTARRSTCLNRLGALAWSSGRSRSVAVCILPTLLSGCDTHPRTRVALPSINSHTSAYTVSRRPVHSPRLWPCALEATLGDQAHAANAVSSAPAPRPTAQAPLRSRTASLRPYLVKAQALEAQLIDWVHTFQPDEQLHKLMLGHPPRGDGRPARPGPQSPRRATDPAGAKHPKADRKAG